jgi:hypothetical protein
MTDDTVDLTAPVDMEKVRQRAEDEQFAQMQAQAIQEGQRQDRDNAVAERMRNFGTARATQRPAQQQPAPTEEAHDAEAQG